VVYQSNGPQQQQQQVRQNGAVRGQQGSYRGGVPQVQTVGR
jgi:hypothetical protein